MASGLSSNHCRRSKHGGWLLLDHWIVEYINLLIFEACKEINQLLWLLLLLLWLSICTKGNHVGCCLLLLRCRCSHVACEHRQTWHHWLRITYLNWHSSVPEACYYCCCSCLHHRGTLATQLLAIKGPIQHMACQGVLSHSTQHTYMLDGRDRYIQIILQSSSSVQKGDGVLCLLCKSLVNLETRPGI